uniref:Glycosyl hydrolase, BNR repeat-containing protein n=1 Tax=Solibacter usitatus (strain Ellin6076) TaxID=234267 RepID=Q026F2_SOLUE
MNLSAVLLLAAAVLSAQSWTPQISNSRASLRGVSAVDTANVWASGSGGTYLVTSDAGATWRAAKVPGAESLDFRGIRAIDSRTVYLMSAGSGDKSRIYKTTDGGEHWALQFTNPDPKGFFDAIAFWDATHGVVVGDQLDGRAEIRTTDDGGLHWERRDPPAGLPNEGAFAASNTCLTLFGAADVWFGTGGPGAARVFHSKDRGRTWTVAPTPIRNDGASAGIFSLAFFDSNTGIAVGGDYAKDKESRQVIAVTRDGGATWSAPAAGPAGFRSAIVYVPDLKFWIATGTSGSDISPDGLAWKQFDSAPYNALSFSGRSVWAVGPQGRIAALRAAQ